ncbi:MAG: zinc-ribbon domain-containing protein [Promethearchaeota archaeon]
MPKLKFCPKCGTELKGARFCPNCGYDISQEIYQDNAPKEVIPANNTAVASSNSYADGLWPKIEPYIRQYVGGYVWWILLIVSIIFILYGIYAVTVISLVLGINTADIWFWYIIGPIIEIIFIFLWVKPKFCDRIKAQKYDELLDDTLKIGSVQIPWMLIFGVLLMIFGNGWLGLLVLVPAILIIFVGPRVPYNWKV